MRDEILPIIDKLKKVEVEVDEINLVHDSVVFGIDYGKMEEAVAATVTLDEEGNAHLKETCRIAGLGEEEATEVLIAYKQYRFIQTYFHVGADFNNLVGLSPGDERLLLEEFLGHFPHFKRFLYMYGYFGYLNPCGEVPLGEPMKCLPPPEKKDDPKGV